MAHTVRLTTIGVTWRRATPPAVSILVVLLL
jgi:hypothetical protein